MTDYQQAKRQLKELAQEVKRLHPSDKPAQRQAINDYCHNLVIIHHLSEKRADNLHAYAGSLHPKQKN